ncbi:hypothetical protein L218DRAFT_949011 [Marasmius fiardii PR-910]|nr:hypothetical protein L218DRAFT_949011 [Marasmius fiardii PR-910]
MPSTTILPPPPTCPILEADPSVFFPHGEYTDDLAGSLSNGVEITAIVTSGLTRASPHVAVKHIQSVMRERDNDIAYEGPSSTLFHIYPADTRLSLDYAYIALKSDVSNIPRADILETLRCALNSRDDMIAHWHISHGLDKSRRVILQVDTETDAKALKEKLEGWVRLKKYEFQP